MAFQDKQMCTCLNNKHFGSWITNVFVLFRSTETWEKDPYWKKKKWDQWKKIIFLILCMHEWMFVWSFLQSCHISTHWAIRNQHHVHAGTSESWFAVLTLLLLHFYINHIRFYEFEKENKCRKSQFLDLKKYMGTEMPTGAVYFWSGQYVCERTKSHKCGWPTIKENMGMT